MCITQLLSAAQSTSDPVATMSAIFSASMAVDVAGFLTAKVPPNPQQDSTPESSTRKWNGSVDRRLESEVFGIAMPVVDAALTDEFTLEAARLVWEQLRLVLGRAESATCGHW